MHILPIFHSYNKAINSTRNMQTKFESNNSLNQKQNQNSHRYTGVASRDLAYVSMFDNEIAKDLKLMGLI